MKSKQRSAGYRILKKTSTTTRDPGVAREQAKSAGTWLQQGLVLAVIAWVLLSAAGQIWAGKAPSIVVEDLAGKSINPFLPATAKALVFVFMSVDCPICNRYAPELSRLKGEFETNGVVIKLVYPNPDESGESIRQHAKDFGLDLEEFRDPAHVLVKSAGAKVTPEAAVFLPKRGFVYCGRIDDRFAKLGVARSEITEHDLREVLSDVLKGDPIKHKQAQGVGCAIPKVR